MPASDLISSSAVQVVERLRAGEITPHDCLDALEGRIAEVENKVNALPILCFDRARTHADALMQKPAAERGLLAGLPVPIKDLSWVAGVLSTSGSPIFKNFVPDSSDIVVEKIEAEGGIVYAKSNTPEFGAGGNTFNPVWGATLNPWNTSRTSAGSSGGAAAALASGAAWLAHGSDMGGSLRNPASFCGIVGMRPTPGRVASNNRSIVDQTLGVQGPMARTVEDLALLFDAMSGEDRRDLLSKPRPAKSFLSEARSGWLPKKVAYSRNLGITPVDPEIAEITRRAAERFAEAGVIVEEATPDLSGAHECFRVLRARNFATGLGPLVEQHRDKFKVDIIWNVEDGFRLTADEIARAERQRTLLAQRMDAFLGKYDLLLCPATVVAAFPVEQVYLTHCDGYEYPNYIEWLSIAYGPTLCGVPALSLPCGFTRENLPVGLQVVGPTNADARVVAGAKALDDPGPRHGQADRSARGDVRGRSAYRISHWQILPLCRRASRSTWMCVSWNPSDPGPSTVENRPQAVARSAVVSAASAPLFVNAIAPPPENCRALMSSALPLPCSDSFSFGRPLRPRQL
jgi:amidase